MERTKFLQLIETAETKQAISVDLNVRFTPYPYYDIFARTGKFSIVYFGKVNDLTGASTTTHTVCVGVYLNEGVQELSFKVWCADKFLEGRLTADEANERVTEACGAISDGRTRRGVAGEMKIHLGVMPESGACDFWRVHRANGSICDHVSAFLAHLRETEGSAEAVADKLIAEYQSHTGKKTQVKAAPSQNLLDQFAFRVPVLFEGDRGAGKTVTARAYARDNKLFCVEVGGHEGIEAPDLLGYLVPLAQGGMIWKDGPMAQAFRRAQKERVVLIIDELLRVPQRELSLLLTALSPDNGTYRLRTGRITAVEDGIGVEEELVVPCDNLCVIATTNVGAEYAVDDIDPALAERFMPIRKDTTVEELRIILGQLTKAKGFPDDIAKKCVEFFQRMTEAKKRGVVKNAPTTRTLARAIELAESATDVSKMLTNQVLLWVARTSEGYPVTEQREDVEKLIKRCFG